jgi:hypothetical protein
MTQRLQRGFAWLSVLLLVAGVVVFVGSRTGDEDAGADASPPANAPPAVPADPLPPETQPTAKDVPRAARVTAGEFILAAAGREDLPKAWKLSHPDLKAQCGCTYKGWLTGNIPVQYYPVDNLDVASFAVQEATPNYVVLHVALLPEERAKVKPQSFFIGLRPVGKGAKKKWLVDYWAPYASIEVPALPEG